MEVGCRSSVLASDFWLLFSGSGIARIKRKVKGIWWMPWRREAMKDVARCDKPRGGASAR